MSIITVYGEDNRFYDFMNTNLTLSNVMNDHIKNQRAFYSFIGADHDVCVYGKDKTFLQR